VSFVRQSARAVLLGRQFPIYQRLRPDVVAAAADSRGEEDKFGMVSASNGGDKKMAAIEKAGTSVQRCAVAYAFTGVPWLAIPWHCPLGIYIQVSVQRISTSKGLPAASVPLLKSPVAMAVSPKTVTFNSA